MQSLAESRENIFYIDDTRKLFCFAKKENFETFCINTSTRFGEYDLELLSTTANYSHIVSVSSINFQKKKIYFVNLGTGGCQIFKINAKKVVSYNSEFDGDFFYLAVENFNLFNIPTVHIFEIKEEKVERSLIIEIPDFTFISSIFSFHGFLLVFAKSKIVVMKRDDPARFSVSHFCDLPFNDDRVDFISVFGSRWIGMINKEEGFIVANVNDILKKYPA